MACAVPAGPDTTTSPTEAPEAPKRGGVLHFPIRQAMDNLDGYTGFGFSPNAINWPRYEPLVIFKRSPDRDHRIDFDTMPWLAERWEQQGPTTFVFHLRKGVKWHDGQELTAEDPAFTIGLVNDASKGYRSRRFTEQIAEAKALDRYTLQLQLKRENIGFLSDLTEVYILPKHVADRGDSFARVSIGTGPFKTLDFDSRAGFAMGRNADYWDAPRPHVDGVVGHYGLDDSAMLAGFVAQQLDLLTVEVNQLEVVRRSVPDVRVNRFMADYGNSLYFRLDKEPYSDVRVRRAMHLALDRQAMLETITQGQGVLNPPGFNGQKEGYAWSQDELLKMPGYNRATKQQDLQEAKRLLAEAGYPNGFSDKVLFSKATSTTPPIVEMAAGQLKTALGIDLTLEGVDAALYGQRDLRGDFNVQMALPARMDMNVREKYHSKSALTSGKLNDAELDRLIEALESTGDREKQRATARDIQKLLQEKMYAVPTIEIPFFPLSHAWVRNFNFGYGNPHAAPYWLGSDTWLDVERMPAARRNETAKLAGR